MYFHPHFDKLSQSYSCSQYVNKGTPSSYYLTFVSYISLGTKYIHLTLIYHESVSKSSTLTFATSLSSSSSCWFVKVFNLHMLVHFSWFTRQEVCRHGHSSLAGHQLQHRFRCCAIYAMDRLPLPSVFHPQVVGSLTTG